MSSKKNIIILGGYGNVTNIIIDYCYNNYNIYCFGRNKPSNSNKLKLFYNIDLHNTNLNTIINVIKNLQIHYIIDPCSVTSPTQNYDLNINIVNLTIKLCKYFNSIYIRISTMKTNNSKFKRNR